MKSTQVHTLMRELMSPPGAQVAEESKAQAALKTENARLLQELEFISYC